MKVLYRLTLPKGTSDFMLKESIDVPATLEGHKFAEWWHTAPLAARQAVAATNNFLETYKKIAADFAQPVTEKTRQDMVDAIRRAEQSNEAMGDSSGASQPPVQNP